MSKDKEYPNEEIERRREEALKRMLSTPHQPHNSKPKVAKIPRKPSAKSKTARSD